VRKKRKPRRFYGPPRKGIYLIPNLLTTGSLFCGFYTLISAIEGNFLKGACAILIAFFLDGIDGRIARATRTTSRFGVEYDSLSDLVAFGIAPGVLIYLWGLTPFGRVGWLAAFLYAACGALRLARFNVQKERINHNYFVGLPIPSAATFIATTILLVESLKDIETSKYLSILVMIFVLSFLMVSNIPYKSFKEVDLFKKKPFRVLVTFVLMMVVILAHPQIMLFVLSSVYVISGPIEGLLLIFRKRRVKIEVQGEGV
jgi:CDP-diacylglycerol--serine O-phosphatidyltransferase